MYTIVQKKKKKYGILRSLMIRTSVNAARFFRQKGDVPTIRAGHVSYAVILLDRCASVRPVGKCQVTAAKVVFFRASESLSRLDVVGLFRFFLLDLMRPFRSFGVSHVSVFFWCGLCCRDDSAKLFFLPVADTPALNACAATESVGPRILPVRAFCATVPSPIQGLTPRLSVRH